MGELSKACCMMCTGMVLTLVAVVTFGLPEFGTLQEQCDVFMQEW